MKTDLEQTTIPEPDSSIVVCIHEDRVEYLAGIKLTVLSFLHHCPTLPVIVSFPNPPISFRHWLDTLSNVKLLDDSGLAGLGWNVKPTLLLHCLQQGYPDVIWIDADILINGDFRSYFAFLDSKTLVVAQEHYWGPEQGGNYRATAWGLKPGRSLPATANTGIIRVTPYHVDLLQTWQALLQHPAYIHAQSLPSKARPMAMLTDQEVLTALLSSEKFSHVPLKMVKRGSEIAQCFGAAGYTPIERLSSLFRPAPLFIHAMGNKPWRKATSAELWRVDQSLRKRLRTYYDSIHLELTPYVSIAQQYRARLEEETAWMDARTIPARLLQSLFLGHPTLQELPLSLLESAARRLRQMLQMVQAKYRQLQSTQDK